MSDLRNKADKFSVSKYRGKSYKPANVDPIPPTETIVTGFGKDTGSEIQNVVDKILSTARENGEKIREKRLAGIITKNIDEFHLKQ